MSDFFNFILKNDRLVGRKTKFTAHQLDNTDLVTCLRMGLKYIVVKNRFLLTLNIFIIDFKHRYRFRFSFRFF